MSAPSDLPTTEPGLTGSSASLAPSRRARRGLRRPYRSGGKRFFDLAVVLVTVPLWLAVIAVLAILVAITSGGQPFYRQARVGQNGRIYTMWKLRSMAVDADGALEAYLDANPDARAEWDSTQKLRHDPRITPVGRFIRKTSLDELPQLFNVLAGDMSLVGPRPMMPEQRPLYHGQAYDRLRPGITGLWQITERNEGTFVQRVGYDETYWRAVSLKLDIKVLLATVRVVLRGTGV